MFLSENNNNINIIQPFANNQYQRIFNYNSNQYAINITFNKDGSSATYSIGYDLDNFIYTSSNISIIQDSLTTNYYGVLNTENHFETNDFTVNFIEFNFDSNYTILIFVEKTTMYMSQNAWNKLNFIYPSEYQTFVNWQYSSSDSLNQIILDPTSFISPNPYLVVLKLNLINVQITFNISPSDKPSSDKPSSDKPSSDKPSSDKPSSDKPSSDKLSSDKPSSDKPSSDKPSSDKLSSDKPSSDKLSSDKLSSDKPSSDKLSSHKPSSDKPSSDKLSSDKLSSDKPSSDKLSSHKPSSDKLSSDKLSSDKLSSDKPSSDKLSSDKPSSDKLSSDKLSSDKPSSDKLSSDKPSSDKLSSDKPSSDKLSSDKPSSDKLSSDKLSSDKPSSDKLSSDKLSSDKLSSDKLSSDKLTSNKSFIYNLSLNNNTLYLLDNNSKITQFICPFFSISPLNRNFIISNDGSIKYIGNSPININISYSIKIKEIFNLVYYVKELYTFRSKIYSYDNTLILPLQLLISSNILKNNEPYNIKNNNSEIMYPFFSKSVSFELYNFNILSVSSSINLVKNDTIKLSLSTNFYNLTTFISTLLQNIGYEIVPNFNKFGTTYIDFNNYLQFTNFNFQITSPI